MGKPKRTAATTSGPAATGKSKPRRLWARILLWSLVGVLSLGLVAGGVVAYAYSTIKLPDANADFRTNTTFVYYDDGKTPIGSFQVQNRVTIDYSAMPQTVKDAIVAAENGTFWTDPGISVTGIFRAALGLVGISSADQTASGGGSTLTQQYIKLMYLNQERSFTRKFTEILLAAKMGQFMSKEDILRDYLNTVYFGRGAYGIEAAAQTYFKLSAPKLDLAQSVALAAIVNSPGNLDPAKGPKQAADLLERYQYTLNNMLKAHTITSDQHDAIYAALPKFAKEDDNARLGGQTGFLLDIVRKELLAKGFTDEQISGGGLKVITTFRKDAQDAAVSVAKDQTLRASYGDKKKAKTLHAAIASVDNETGGVIALYGNPDYVTNSRNWATTPRETGSTFKTYALAAALRDGWTLGDKVSAQTIRHGSGYLPNPNGKKQVTLQAATTNSIDPAYFNLVSQLSDGGAAVTRAANDAGVPTGEGWGNDAYMPLGTPMVSPLDQASGYSTFANLGVHRAWHVITEVKDADNKRLYAPDVAGEQTVEPDVAQDVTYALTQVVRSGTGRAAGYIGYPVAGKTGTKGQPNPNGYGRQTVATWFVGYTKQITTAVMYVRGDSGHEDLGASWYGGGAAAQTWASYMRIAMNGLPREGFLGPTNHKSTQTPKPAPITPLPTPVPTASDTSVPTTEPSPTQSATSAPPSESASSSAPPSPSATTTS